MWNRFKSLTQRQRHDEIRSTPILRQQVQGCGTIDEVLSITSLERQGMNPGELQALGSMHSVGGLLRKPRMLR